MVGQNWVWTVATLLWILLLCLLSGSHAAGSPVAVVHVSPTASCSVASQAQALLSLYQQNGGTTWRNISGWSGTLQDYLALDCAAAAGSGPTVLLLPGYCCNYGVECCTEVICGMVISPVDGDANHPYTCGCAEVGRAVNITLNSNNGACRWVVVL